MIIRKTILQNYKTGKIIKANSITEFCKLAKLSNNDKFHFSSVLSGSRLHHKGWGLPRKDNHIICDIYGNEYHMTNLYSFSKTYRKNPERMLKLINCDIPHYNGLFLLGLAPPLRHNSRFVFYFQKGKKVVKGTVQELSNVMNCSRRSIYNVLIGVQSTISGWSFIKAEPKVVKGRKILKK